MQAYEKLKSSSINAPILGIYSPQDESELHCDASAISFGAILMQRKIDRKFIRCFIFKKIQLTLNQGIIHFN